MGLTRVSVTLRVPGSIQYTFGLAQIEFMSEITAGRVIFRPDGTEPILGVTALESVGITVDPATQTLRRLPAIPLKARVLRHRAGRPSDRRVRPIAPADTTRP